jgi:hypothetical protein
MFGMFDLFVSFFAAVCRISADCTILTETEEISACLQVLAGVSVGGGM